MRILADVQRFNYRSTRSAVMDRPKCMSYLHGASFLTGAYVLDHGLAPVCPPIAFGFRGWRVPWMAEKNTWSTAVSLTKSVCACHDWKILRIFLGRNSAKARTELNERVKMRKKKEPCENNINLIKD